MIAAEDGPQVLVGRFMYGPLDMVALTGEKVQGPGNLHEPQRMGASGRTSRGKGQAWSIWVGDKKAVWLQR